MAPLWERVDREAPGTAPLSLVLDFLAGPDAFAFAGPSTAFAGVPEKGSLAGPVAAYAALRVLPKLDRVPNGPEGVAGLVGRARQNDLPAGKLTPAEYVAWSYGFAMAARLLDHPEEILRRARQAGLALTPELVAMQQGSGGKPISADELLGPRLSSLDFKSIAAPGWTVDPIGTRPTQSSHQAPTGPPPTPSSSPFWSPAGWVCRYPRTCRS